ncbi:MAG: hypothetical protein AAF388_00100 [Bacteroidota bacterium]
MEKLRKEFTKGQERLDQLEEERQETQQTMLRISGAIQVLEEILAETTTSIADGKGKILNHSSENHQS